jgi:hypothetical protein
MQRLETGGEPWPGLLRSGRDILIVIALLHAGTPERIMLQIKLLLFR